MFDTTDMTKLALITGSVYTHLPPAEVRTYLQGGSKTGSIEAYTEQGDKIILAVHAIEYIYE